MNFTLRVNKPLVRSLSTVTPIKVPECFLETFPGTRLFNIPEAKKPFNRQITTQLANHIKYYHKNEMVPVIGISLSTRIPNFVPEQDSQYTVEEINTINALCKFIHEGGKRFVGIIDGEITDNAYSIFAACEHRIGTVKATYSIDSLFKNKIPYGGALMRALVPQPDGPGLMYARFLGMTGWKLDAFDMAGLGLIQYVVPEHPETTLFSALGSTSPDDSQKLYQACPITLDALPELLEAMSLTDNPFLSKQIYEHELWNRYSAVHPKTVTHKFNFPAQSIEDRSIFEFERTIKRVFALNTYDEIKKVLEELSTSQNNLQAEFAQHCLTKINQLDPEVANTWLTLIKKFPRISTLGALKYEMEILQKPKSYL